MRLRTPVTVDEELEATKPRKTSFTLPAKMRADLMPAVLRDGYGAKGKSAWIKDALSQLLRDPDWISSVVELELLGGNDDSDNVTIRPKMLETLTDACDALRANQPRIERPQGAILRAAVARGIASSILESGHRTRHN